MAEKPTNTSRRKFLKYSVTGVAVAAAATGGAYYYGYLYQQSQTSKKIDLNIGLLSNIDEMPAFVATDQGFFAKYNLNSRISSFTNPGTLTDALTTGSVDLATLAVPSFISQAANTGKYSRLVSPLNWYGEYQGRNYPGGTAMLRTDLADSVKSLTDLKGKTVASYGAGTFVDVITRTLLGRAGLNPATDVTIVYLSFPSMVEAFATKKIDFVFTIPAPFKQQLIQNRYARIFVDPKYIPNGISYTSAIGTDRVPITAAWSNDLFLNTNPEACEGIRKGIADAIAWMRSNPDESASLAAKHTGVSVDLAKEALSEALYVPYASGFSDWQKYYPPVMNVMVTGGIIKAPIDLRPLVTTPCFKPT